MQYDVFISHSSIDKDDVARPLAEALQERGLSVWLDEEQLHIGDSINRDIGKALHKSRFVIVILSPAYLESEWGQKELDAAFAKEKHDPKTILPIYHHVDVADVERHWTFLADKIALTTDDSPEILADKIQASITRVKGESTQATAIKRTPLWKRKSVISAFALSVAASIVAAVIMMPWVSDDSSGNNQSISIGGNVENSTIAPTIIEGDQINNHIDEEALARRLVEKMGLPSGDMLQQKDEEIKRLTETITRLQQDPANEFKQAALKKLEEDKPQEATALLEKSIAERAKARQELDKQEAQDWVDIGNIAYLTDTQKALDAYQKAVALDANNIGAWNQLGNIYQRLGKLDDAIQAYEAVKNLAGTDQLSQAGSYVNLGLVYQTRGEFGKAEALHLKALNTFTVLGWQEGIALTYGNLGTVYEMRGELDKAEAFQIKALNIYTELGFQEGMASVYGSLGLIYFSRGNTNDQEKAEKFYIKALEIYEALGKQHRMASNYGNLGIIYFSRREFDKAEKLYIKALNFYKLFGEQGGVASQYGNLGNLYKTLGKLDKAEEFHLKSLNIEKMLRRQHGMASEYRSLSQIYEAQGEFDKAEGFLIKSLEIYEMLGWREIMTNQYIQLGNIHESRNEFDKAEVFFFKALKTNEALGWQEGIGFAYSKLGNVYAELNDEKNACQHWQNSSDIYKKIDVVTAQNLQDWIDEHCKQ